MLSCCTQLLSNEWGYNGQTNAEDTSSSEAVSLYVSVRAPRCVISHSRAVTRPIEPQLPLCIEPELQKYSWHMQPLLGSQPRTVVFLLQNTVICDSQSVAGMFLFTKTPRTPCGTPTSSWCPTAAEPLKTVVIL